MQYLSILPEIGVMIQHKSQKENKTCFNAHFQYSQSKITGLNKMWSSKI